MEEKINQILQNQIEIMEVLRRITDYPHHAEQMEKAIEATEKLCQAAVNGSLPCQHEWIWNHAMGKHYCKCGAETQ